MLELRLRDEVLVRLVGLPVLHVGDARQLGLRLLLGLPHDDVRGHAERFERGQPGVFAAALHLVDLRAELVHRAAVRQVRVGEARDRALARLALAARVDAGRDARLRLEVRVLHVVVLARERERRLGPEALEDRDELLRARVPVVVFREDAAVLPGLLRPPGAHHVEGEPTARDLVDGRRLLRRHRRQVVARTHRGHDLEPLRRRRQRSRERPGLEARRRRPLDVVEVELRHERQVEADPLGTLREPLHVVEGDGHVLVLDVAQPAAEERGPVSESHEWFLAGGE